MSITPEQFQLVCSLYHDEWVIKKTAEGWQYGAKYNGINKLSPMVIPFDQLDLKMRGTVEETIRRSLLAMEQAGLIEDGTTESSVPESESATLTATVRAAKGPIPVTQFDSSIRPATKFPDMAAVPESATIPDMGKVPRGLEDVPGVGTVATTQVGNHQVVANDRIVNPAGSVAAAAAMLAPPPVDEAPDAEPAPAIKKKKKKKKKAAAASTEESAPTKKLKKKTGLKKKKKKLKRAV